MIVDLEFVSFLGMGNKEFDLYHSGNFFKYHYVHIDEHLISLMMMETETALKLKQQLLEYPSCQQIINRIRNHFDKITLLVEDEIIYGSTAVNLFVHICFNTEEDLSLYKIIAENDLLDLNLVKKCHYFHNDRLKQRLTMTNL